MLHAIFYHSHTDTRIVKLLAIRFATLECQNISGLVNRVHAKRVVSKGRRHQPHFRASAMILRTAENFTRVHRFLGFTGLNESPSRSSHSLA